MTMPKIFSVKQKLEWSEFKKECEERNLKHQVKGSREIIQKVERVMWPETKEVLFVCLFKMREIIAY